MHQGVDPSTGNFTGKLDFDPFGNMIGGTGTARSAYQWQAQSGYRSDGDIGGLLKVGYRSYDPQVGRFTT